MQQTKQSWKAIFSIRWGKNKVLNNTANAKIIRNHYALKYHEEQFLKIIQQAEFPTLLNGACVPTCSNTFI